MNPGDSGSSVLLNEERYDRGVTVISLAYGANASISVAYMAPIDLNVEDIEENTGGKVIYPVDMGTILRDLNMQR